MSVHHQHQQVVAGAVPCLLGALEQALDLAGVEEVLVALMRVGCMRRDPLGNGTLAISPCSSRPRNIQNSSGVSTKHFLGKVGAGLNRLTGPVADAHTMALTRHASPRISLDPDTGS